MVYMLTLGVYGGILMGSMLPYISIYSIHGSYELGSHTFSQANLPTSNSFKRRHEFLGEISQGPPSFRNHFLDRNHRCRRRL